MFEEDRVVEEYIHGNIVIRIHDKYYRGQTKEQTKAILDKYAAIAVRNIEANLTQQNLKKSC